MSGRLNRAAAQQPNKVDVDKDDDDANKIWSGYSWESNKLRSWDQIEEDPETGRLKSYEKAKQIARKRRRDDGLSGVRRGVIRFCVIVLDMSDPLRNNDYKPTRAELAVDAATSFVNEFLEQNPISQLALVMTRDADAARLAGFSNNAKKINDALRSALRHGPRGTASLQNGLGLARRLLSAVPPYGLREVLICFGSLSTCDPGDIHSTIAKLAEDKVRCVAVGMAAELYVLRALTKKTLGSYVIAFDENHFRESLSAHVVPPPTTSRQVSPSLIRMGFPMLRRQAHPTPYCNNPTTRGRMGYNCPRCNAWLSDVPCECVLCGLTLVSSPHLARSYHHLFPVSRYSALDSFKPPPELAEDDAETVQDKIETLRNAEHVRCVGCTVLLKKDNALRVVCPKCLCPFCIDCDAFVHESLHQCPGCDVHQHRQAIVSS